MLATGNIPHIQGVPRLHRSTGIAHLAVYVLDLST